MMQAYTTTKLTIHPAAARKRFTVEFPFMVLIILVSNALCRSWEAIAAIYINARFLQFRSLIAAASICLPPSG
jgi:hypothetical protein